jgi:hypothetical protein
MHMFYLTAIIWEVNSFALPETDPLLLFPSLHVMY